MPPAPAKASDDVRERMITALKTPGRRFLDRNGSSGNWLVQWGVTENTIYEELVAGLTVSDRLFLKPRQQDKPQAYQCILEWPEDGDDYPAVVVHVTLAPRGDPPRVRVALHPSDTVRSLPPLPTPDENDENEPA